MLVMCLIISVCSACVCLAELAARWREVRSTWKEPSDHKKCSFNDLLKEFNVLRFCWFENSTSTLYCQQKRQFNKLRSHLNINLGSI